MFSFIVAVLIHIKYKPAFEIKTLKINMLNTLVQRTTFGNGVFSMFCLGVGSTIKFDLLFEEVYWKKFGPKA